MTDQREVNSNSPPAESFSIEGQVEAVSVPEPNVAKLKKNFEKSVDLLTAWDHTGDPNHQIAGDIGSALKTIDDTLILLHRVEHDSQYQDKTADIIKFLEAKKTGFQYRRENRLPSIYRQRDEIRQKLAAKDFQTAASMLEMMGAQSDTSELVTVLKKEYAQVMEIIEELSDEQGDFELDISKLWNKVFTHNQGLDSATSIIQELLPRYQQVAIFKRNLELLLPWAKMQGREGELITMRQALPELQIAILDRVAGNIRQLIAQIWRDKLISFMANNFRLPDKHEGLDPRRRIEAAIADLQTEFSKAKVLMKTDDLEQKLQEVESQIRQAQLLDRQPVRQSVHQVATVIKKAMGKATDEVSLEDLQQRRLELIALKKNLSAALKVTKEAEEFLEQM